MIIKKSLINIFSFTFLCVLIGISTALTAHASTLPFHYDLETKGVNYKILKSDDGKPEKSVAAIIKNETENITIPEQVLIKGISYTVTVISSSSVPYDTVLPPNAKKIRDKKEYLVNRKVKRISVPPTVSSIESGAFNRFISLKKIVVSSRNPIYKVIKNGLYSKNGKILYAVWGKKSNFRIQNGTKKIADRAFAYTSFKKVVLPGSCSTIGKYTFFDCKKLSKINLSHVKKTGKYAFANTKIKETSAS